MKNFLPKNFKYILGSLSFVKPHGSLNFPPTLVPLSTHV